MKPCCIALPCLLAAVAFPFSGFANESVEIVLTLEQVVATAARHTGIQQPKKE